MNIIPFISMKSTLSEYMGARSGLTEIINFIYIRSGVFKEFSILTQYLYLRNCKKCVKSFRSIIVDLAILYSRFFDSWTILRFFRTINYAFGRDARISTDKTWYVYCSVCLTIISFAHLPHLLLFI